MTRLGRFSYRRRRACLAAAVALLALGPKAAQADDLPATLVAAAAEFGKAANERQCAFITGLSQHLPARGGPDTAISVAPTESYGPATVGAYLGDDLPGQTPPAFVQALVDAGVAKAVALTWMGRDRRTVAPKPASSSLPPEFRGLMPQNLPPVQSMGAPEPTGTRGVAFLVTGPDQVLFARPEQAGSSLTPVPPNLAGKTFEQDARPAGVWGSDRLCWKLIPDRVLEYGDPVDHGNGLVDVTAAVLFHPERVPAWISDPRVIGAVRPPMPPQTVLWLDFRNAGDGWRYVRPGSMIPPEKTHILEKE